MKTIFFTIALLFSTVAFSQTSGFYTYSRDPGGIYVKDSVASDSTRFNVVFAENGISSNGWEIRRELKDSYSYPVHGWTWFENENDALVEFKLKKYQK